MVIIYQLVDPLDGSVRWVGMTHNLKARMVEHLNCSKRGNIQKNYWINGLKQQGLSPRDEVIEEVPENLAVEREMYWIQFYVSEGEPLLNAGVICKPTGAGRRSTTSEFWEKVAQWQETGVCPWASPNRARHYLKVKHGVIIS